MTNRAYADLLEKYMSVASLATNVLSYLRQHRHNNRGSRQHYCKKKSPNVHLAPMHIQARTRNNDS